jgi:dTDP-4-amino-4,6-dideoxygalactose transaminase
LVTSLNESSSFPAVLLSFCTRPSLKIDTLLARRQQRVVLFHAFVTSTNRLASLRNSAKSKKMTIGEAPYERIVSLPIFPGIDGDSVDDVIEALWKVITAYAIGTPAASFATTC